MFKLNFQLQNFASSLQATQDEIVSIPDFVTVSRDEDGDENWGSGNLIDCHEAYIATADQPFAITLRRVVTAGQNFPDILSEWTETAGEKEALGHPN